MSKRLLLVAPLALLAAGFTDCEYFTDVTVPANDTTAPTAFDGVWVGGDYVASTVGAPFTYHLAPGRTVLSVAAGIDSSGLHRLAMYSTFRYTCCSASICSLTQPSSAPQVETQPGGVGDSVSNGIWLHGTVRLPTCSSGLTLRSYSYSWFTEAEDFHGNRVRSQTSSIVYP